MTIIIINMVDYEIDPEVYRASLFKGTPNCQSRLV